MDDRIGALPFLRSAGRRVLARGNREAYAVLVASCFSWGLVTGPQLEEPIELSLADAPLSAFASVRRVSPEALVAKLAAQGVKATPDDTVRGLAVRHHTGANRLFGIIFDVS